MMHELLHHSVEELAGTLARGDVSSEEVVRTHLDRIAEADGAVRAVAELRRDAALREAREADAHRLSGAPLGPLHGVPCTIKEFVGVEGMPQTSGILARRGIRAAEDATVVKRLRAAGAIVMGVTNVPEGGLWHETNNRVYGRTSNPHDLHRTSGGSSGGEGAVVAYGGSPFGIGSDTGGSIRFPAGFCGVAGHKPTGGLVPNTGHFPGSPGGPDRPMSTGPLARRASDLPLIMRVLAGADGIDPQCDRVLGVPHRVDWSTLRVHRLPMSWCDVDVRTGLELALRTLENLGASVVELDLPDADRAFQLWAALLAESDASYADILGDEPLIPDLIRWFAGRSTHVGGVLAILGIEKLLARFQASQAPLVEAARRLRTDLDAALGDNGVLLHPVYPRTAPRHRGLAFHPPQFVSTTTLFNIAESPVTVLRVGTDCRGLPLAVQVAGRRGADQLTMAVAAELEQQIRPFAPVEPRWGPLPWPPLFFGS